MSSSRLAPPPLPQLTAGNIVSCGFHLYRQQAKTYLSLTGQAYLWLLVPIYGWAQFFALSALISRLAYYTLIGQPESVAAGRAALRPQWWSFFGLALLILLIFIAAYIVVLIGGFLLAAGLALLMATVLIPLFGETWGGLIGGGLILFLLALSVFVGAIWLSARIFIPETILAIEGFTDAGRALKRSWQLSRRAILRISLIVSSTFLLMLPIAILSNYLPSLYMITLDPIDTPLYGLIYLVSLGLSLVGGMMILPLWQCVKAVVYYDLRMRQEGMDLVLRDRSFRPADSL